MNIAIFKPGETPQYLTSVNGAEYMADPTALEGSVAPKDSTVLINPDISAVSNIPFKFWKKSGDTIVEMSAVEKQVIADAELLQRKLTANTFSSSPIQIFTALIKVINIRLPTGQKITKQEVIDAIKLEIT